MIKKFHCPDFNYEVTTGKYAQQADGAIWLQQGGTIVLATVVCAPSQDFPGFLPLSVEYKEQLSAAGKIPGGYFKREGRSTDKEVLTSRLIDRALRPLFADNYFDTTQIIITVYSVDKEHEPHTLAFVAASLALSISKIPFMGPVGIIEVARVDNQWIFAPSYAQAQASDIKILVAGNAQGINMVEGKADGITEEEFVEVIFKAHEKIKIQIAWQESIQQQVGVAKQAITHLIDWKIWHKRAQDYLASADMQALFVADKITRTLAIKNVNEQFHVLYADIIEQEKVNSKIVNYILDVELTQAITAFIFSCGKRIDGRSFDEVRAISTEVGLLPFTHGSAVFKRGRTQALAMLTLGGGQDEQKIEDLMGETHKKSFLLHYNFPSFCVGEARPMRGPGRREVGHSYLAAAALESILPVREVFPYTTRLVIDILECDGSSSMATVCSSIMALMNGGVPIKHMVSGIAMGLLQHPDGTFQALSDISGIEDAFGLMDFKVAGTVHGITAVQMDVKYKGGLSKQVFINALAQAKAGRLHILQQMQIVMSAPNAKLSDLVPQIVSVKISPDKIGAIIGTGGKTIREITEKTSTTIDVENDGLVKIYGHPGPKLDQAVGWVKVLSGQIERNSVFSGKIRRLAEFGMFVELVPGVDGLVHISMIPRHLQPRLMQLFKVDDPMQVEVVDYDDSNGRIRLKPTQKFDDIV